MKKKEYIRIIILIIAKKVYNVVICRIGMGSREDHESLFIKSYTLNHIEVCILKMVAFHLSESCKKSWLLWFQITRLPQNQVYFWKVD